MGADRMAARRPRWLALSYALCAALIDGYALGAEELLRSSLPEPVMEAQRLSGRADVLASEGREREAAQLYLEAHLRFASVMEKFFEQAYRASIQGRPAYSEQLLDTNRMVAELQDLNLFKLWLILDPEDRAYALMVEQERADLIHRFPEFGSLASARPLEEFLTMLYAEDTQSARHLEALREGRLPASARWVRLENAGR
jgi:hypothetical protein